MPWSEFVGWKAYFGIYPFTQDREDYRNALLVSAVMNSSGRTLKKMIDVEMFLPDYLGTKQIGKSLEQQKAEKEAFKAKLAATRGKHANR